MKNRGKVGNKQGQPKFRTPSTFIANQAVNRRLESGFKGKNFNLNNSRSMKIFNRGK